MLCEWCMSGCWGLVERGSVQCHLRALAGGRSRGHGKKEVKKERERGETITEGQRERRDLFWRKYTSYGLPGQRD